ncbi:MAG: YtxH domain-containing protein [Rhodocyclaceae bacterium]
MGKKKQWKKAYRREQQNSGYGGYGAAEWGSDDAAAGYDNGALGAGLLKGLGLRGGLPSRQTEQFLLGALIGAAATYVLSDPELRGKIMKGAMKLYTGVAGGLEEFKEQMADLKAETEAEQAGRE